MAERCPEAWILHNLDVIRHAAERFPKPWHSQLVQVQGFPEGPAEREDRDQGDDPERGRDQCPAQPGFGAEARDFSHVLLAPAINFRIPVRSMSALILAAAASSASLGSACRTSARCSSICRISDNSV